MHSAQLPNEGRPSDVRSRFSRILSWDRVLGVTGVLRGAGVSANRVVHLPGQGTFISLGSTSSALVTPSFESWLRVTYLLLCRNGVLSGEPGLSQLVLSAVQDQTKHEMSALWACETINMRAVCSSKVDALVFLLRCRSQKTDSLDKLEYCKHGLEAKYNGH